MDRYLKEIIDNLEIKENYIDNEGSYIEYIETKELNKIFNNVVSKQKVKDKIKELENIKSDENISGSDLSIEEFNKEVINILKEFI